MTGKKVLTVNNRLTKVKKTARELVAGLEGKGVKFNLISMQEAEIYFLEKNNYLRTAVYRQIFDKHQSGLDGQIGKYIHLDFKYFMELSTIDMNLRSLFLKMSIDIEHTLKVKLIAEIEQNEKEDGYQIVELFLNKNPDVLKNIGYKMNSRYVGSLIQSYFDFDDNGQIIFDCPAWVLVEILEFNSFIKFLLFYHNFYQTGKKTKLPRKSIMHSVRQIRNASAHNNCIFYNLRPNPPRKGNVKDKTKTVASGELHQFVAKMEGISKETRDRRLSASSILEIVSLLYTYDVVAPENMKKRRYPELISLISDTKDTHCYRDNEIIKSSIDFLQKVIDNLV